MRLSEIAAARGVNLHTLRAFVADAGAKNPVPSAGTAGVYTEAEAQRIGYALDLAECGFSRRDAWVIAQRLDDLNKTILARAVDSVRLLRLVL